MFACLIKQGSCPFFLEYRILKLQFTNYPNSIHLRKKNKFT